MSSKIRIVDRKAAQPGYFVLSALSGGDDSPSVVHRDPVLAWAFVEADCVPFPITLDGVQRAYAAIERPDGQVDSSADRWYADAATWLASVHHDHASALEVDAEKRASWERVTGKNNQAQDVQP